MNLQIYEWKNQVNVKSKQGFVQSNSSTVKSRFKAMFVT